MEPPTLAATTIRTMRAVCVIPVEEEDKEDGVALALALAEEVSVMYTTVAEVGEITCVGAAVAEGAAAEAWALDGVDWVLLEEVDDAEDDEETEVDVVDRSPLTILPNRPEVVAEVEDEGEGAEDEEDVEVLAAADAVAADADGVVSVLLTVGSAPAPMIGWGLGPPSWGAGTRFLRKRLWLTW